MVAALFALLAAALLVPLPRAGPVLPKLPTWVGHRGRGDARARAELAWTLALAGELRAGSDPVRAVLACSQGNAAAPHATRAARLGGDVAAALRLDADDAGSLLGRVAAVWDLTASSGAGLAGVLDRMAESHRRSQEVRRTLAVELAAPRATARMMSLLPALGIALGIVLGVDPVGWLTTTPIGLGVLLVGVALNLAGFWWIRSIVARVGRSL